MAESDALEIDYDAARFNGPGTDLARRGLDRQPENGDRESRDPITLGELVEAETHELDLGGSDNPGAKGGSGKGVAKGLAAAMAGTDDLLASLDQIVEEGGASVQAM